MHRNRLNLRPTSILLLYAFAATAVGVGAGAALGWAGTFLSNDARAATATLAGLALVGLSALSLGRRRIPPLQCDRETPQRWVHQGALLWPLKNGAALGFGAATRLGFTLWYAVPLGALLSGSPAIGAALWGSYGLVRASGAGLIWYLSQRSGTFDPILNWLPRQKHRAHMLTNVHLMALSTSTFLVVGF